MTTASARAPTRLVHQVAGACRLLWRADRRTFLVVAVTMLASGVAVGPRLIGIRDLLAVMTAPQGARAADFVLPLVLVCASTIVIEGAGNLRPHLERWLDARSSRLAQESILRAAAATEYARFDDPEFHDGLDRAAQGSELRPVQVVQGLNSLVNSAVGSIALVAAVLWSSVLVAGLLLVAYLPVIVVQLRSGRSYYTVHHRMTQADRMRGYLVRLLTNRTSVAELRLHGGDRHLMTRVERAWDERLRRIREVGRVRIGATALSVAGAALATTLASVLLVWLFLRGDLTVTTTGLLLVAMWELGAALSAFGWGVANLLEAGMFLDDYTRFVALAEHGPRPPAPGEGLPRLGAGRGVTMQAVSFHYPESDVAALQDVDLTVGVGEIVALVGASGAGKSTVLRLLTGLYPPTSGTITWGGATVTPTEALTLRHRMSVMFQDFGRYALSVRENIALHDMERADDIAAVVEAATAAGVHDVVTALPGGLRDPPRRRVRGRRRPVRRPVAAARAGAGPVRPLRTAHPRRADVRARPADRTPVHRSAARDLRGPGSDHYLAPLLDGARRRPDLRP